MKQILLVIFPFFPVYLSAQLNPNSNINVYQTRTGKVLEFVSYPMFAISGISAGMSDQFRKIDSSESHRAETFNVVASAGFVTSAGVWGVGISLQGKPTWKDALKLAGAIGFSTVGYYSGKHIANIFPNK